MANVTNGTVRVTVSGGVGPYQYTLLNAGNNNPVPQNAYPTFTNPVNGVASSSFTFGSAADITGNSGLAPGSYKVKIVDGNGCETISTVLTVINTPAPTATPIPTATPVPDPTATAIPDPTATPVPDKMYVSLGDNTGGEANLDEIFQLRISTQGVKEGVKTRFTFESASYNKHFIRVDEEGGEWESDPLSVMIDGAGNGTIFIRVIQGGVPLEITLERNDSDGNETRELTHSVKLLEIRGGEGVNPIDAEPAPVDS